MSNNFRNFTRTWYNDSILHSSECPHCGSKGIYYNPDRMVLHEVVGITARGSVTYLDATIGPVEKDNKTSEPVLFCSTCLERMTIPEYLQLLKEPPVLFRCRRCDALGVGYVRVAEEVHALATIEETGNINIDSLVAMVEGGSSNTKSCYKCKVCGVETPIAEKDVVKHMKALREKKIYEI